MTHNLKSITEHFHYFIKQMAARVAETTLPYFRTELAVENKGNDQHFDPVTPADRACEAALRAQIAAHYPNHGIFGEEYGAENSHADYIWILDPIDGTRAFLSGLPLWGALIGLNYQDKPRLGAMIQPVLQEIFYGTTQQAWMVSPLNATSRPLKTRTTQCLEEATLFTTDPKLFNGQEHAQYQAIEKRCRITRYGLDCYGYAMLAAGMGDLVIESGLKVYDIAPLIPIIEGAGGVVTDWRGNPVGHIHNSPDLRQVIAAANSTLHKVALEYLYSI